MARIRVKCAKYLGDDSLSWAVFLDGHPIVTGCSRDEARYHQRLIREKHAPSELKTQPRVPAQTHNPDGCEICGSLDRNAKGELLHYDEDCFK